MFELNAGGDRLIKVTTHEAGEMLQRFKDEEAANRGDHECKLLLNGRSWHPEAFEMLTPFFVKIRDKVVVLNLSDIIASFNADAGLATFQYLGGTFAGLGNLREFIFDENAVGERGFNSLIHILEDAESLEKISLRELGLNSECADIFAGAIPERVRKNLTYLSLGENDFGSEGAKTIGGFLEACESLQVLRYRYNRNCGDDGTLALCKGISDLSGRARDRDGGRSRPTSRRIRSTTQRAYRTRSMAGSERAGGLRILEMDGLNMQDEAATSLYEALCHSSNLQELCLADCSIYPAQLSILIFGLRESGANNLICLDLEGNKLDGESAEGIADFLEQTPVLQRIEKLVLSNNAIGDDGIVKLVSVLARAPNLMTLLLTVTEMTGVGAQALLDNHLPNLQSFDVQDNRIPQNLVDQLQGTYPRIMVDDYYDDGDTDDGDDDGSIFYQEDDDDDEDDPSNDDSSNDSNVADDDDEVDALADALASSQIY